MVCIYTAIEIPVYRVRNRNFRNCVSGNIEYNALCIIYGARVCTLRSGVFVRPVRERSAAWTGDRMHHTPAGLRLRAASSANIAPASFTTTAANLGLALYRGYGGRRNGELYKKHLLSKTECARRLWQAATMSARLPVVYFSVFHSIIYPRADMLAIYNILLHYVSSCHLPLSRVSNCDTTLFEGNMSGPPVGMLPPAAPSFPVPEGVPAFYVDFEKGADSNPGTVGSPVKTVDAALKLARAGSQKKKGVRRQPRTIRYTHPALTTQHADNIQPRRFGPVLSFKMLTCAVY